MNISIRFNPRSGVFLCWELVLDDKRVIDKFDTRTRAREAVDALKYAHEVMKGTGR